MDGSGAHNFMCLCATEVRMSRLVSPGRHQSHRPWLMSLGPISLHLVQERIGSQISLHLLHFLHCLPCNVYECDTVGNLRLRTVAVILNIWRAAPLRSRPPRSLGLQRIKTVKLLWPKHKPKLWRRTCVRTVQHGLYKSSDLATLCMLGFGCQEGLEMLKWLCPKQ